MTGGEDSDGRGTEGIVEEKSREARPGETGTTRFGMEEGAEADGENTGGLVQNQGAGAAGGVTSGLQPGGTTPGGGPGTSSGSIGTGGASNANKDTGALRRWDKGERKGASQ